MGVTKTYNQFDFKDITITINGNEVALLEEVTHTVDQPKIPVYSKGKVVAIQTGNTTITGSLTIKHTELLKYQRYFYEDGTIPSASKMDDFLNNYFTIVKKYQREGVTNPAEFQWVTDTFENCKFQSTSIANMQGGTGADVTLDFIACNLTTTYLKGA